LLDLVPSHCACATAPQEELDRCAESAERLRKIQEAAIRAQERHAAEARLKEAAQARAEAEAREQRACSVAQVAPLPLREGGATVGDEADRVRPYNDPTASLATDPSMEDSWRVDDALDNGEGGEECGSGVKVVTPAQLRKVRELAAFQEQTREREAALRRRIIAEGGNLLMGVAS
jgi:hypothetical protein